MLEQKTTSNTIEMKTMQFQITNDNRENYINRQIIISIITLTFFVTKNAIFWTHTKKKPSDNRMTEAVHYLY